MTIKLRQPIGYSHIGQKDKQEDTVWPIFENAAPDNRCFILCDGVGGSEHGEIASQTCSQLIGEYISELIEKTDNVSNDDIQDAVNIAYDKLDSMDNIVSKSHLSMATTFTCVSITKDGIVVAHMGDSRIYHVRPNHGILYQSNDHTLVNALLKVGELTQDEAKNFPQRHVITRAIQAHANKRCKAETRKLSDIKDGDYLFLCSDGVLEHLTDERLVEVLSMELSDTDKLKFLEEESVGRTSDNYTAYLIPIDKVIGDIECILED